MATTKTKTLKVEFGTLSKNKGSRRIGASFPCGEIEPNDLRDLLVNAQLQVVLEIDPNAKGDIEGQQKMGHAEPKIAPLGVIAEVRRVSIGDPRCSFSLTLPIDTDAAHLDAFASQAGTLKCKRIGNAASEAESEKA